MVGVEVSECMITVRKQEKKKKRASRQRHEATYSVQRKLKPGEGRCSQKASRHTLIRCWRKARMRRSTTATPDTTGTLLGTMSIHPVDFLTIV
jgi:hypothetical protein